MSIYATSVVLAAYLSLCIELVFLHVPSVASNFQILSSEREIVAGYSSRYQKMFSYSRLTKMLLFMIPLIVIYGVFLLPLLVIVYRADPLSDYAYTPGLAADAVGIAFIVVGRVITLWSVFSIRSANPQQDQSYALRTDGVFRWSRNPGLFGMFVFVIGLWLIAPSAIMAIGILVYLAYMDFKVRMEEDFLLNRFGELYVDYCSGTRRYL